MPTKEQMDSVTQKIGWLQSMSFIREEGRAPEPCSDCALPWWEDLSRVEQRSVIDADVDWEGFSESQREGVINRVIDGQEMERWMEGIDPPPEEVRAEEIRQDEAAARARDYGPQDAATYEQRVREGAELPISGFAEFADMMRDIVNPHSYDQLLKDAATRGNSNIPDKDRGR